MEENKLTELNDLKEIAIGKIKSAYNRSIDAEATHSVLWDITERKRNMLLKFSLLISIFIVVFAYLPFLFGEVVIIWVFSLIAEILAFVIAGLVIYGIFLANYSKAHKQLIHAAILLRRQSLDFLQYKLDNLDKKSYIEELKSLEVSDKDLKEKTQLHTEKISTQLIMRITYNIEELEKAGFKKHVITQQAIDSANEKLQKFNALRTCEAWLKFD
ncbi:MAG: hypothetical protein E3J90_00730 [Promethearchaeota archaeon]|nr:MAG: hypothetical protein E3J90_00730 [Candidatus Lokiarchaeota archaeon]